MKIVTLLLILIASVYCEIKFVFEMLRHGARSPWGVGNKDILGKEWSGDGELTAIGMRQHYLLGHRLRKKYEKFLSSSYRVDEVYVESTFYNRTIMSVFSQLQGLFPPGTGPSLTENQVAYAIPPGNSDTFKEVQDELKLNTLPHLSQVFPIKIIDKRDHNYYLHDANACKGVEGHIKKNMEKKSVKDFVEMYNKKYGVFLKEKFGIKDLDLEKIYLVSDAFISGYTERIVYPEFAEANINQEEFLKDSIMGSKVDVFDHRFDEEGYYLGRMSMSPTMKKIISRMNTRVSYDKDGKGYEVYNAPKLYLLSGHDTNLAAMLSLVKAAFPDAIKEFQFSTFASSILFEFYRKDDAKDYADSSYYVQIILNDVILKEVAFDEFKKAMEKQLIEQEEINKFCGFNVADDGSSALLFLTIVLACFTVGLAVLILIMCHRRRKEAVAYNAPTYTSVV